jgi:peptidoglycan/LPS O-acetylase OafA/YrhL
MEDLAVEYRREVDGLRAIAVLPVILFHAGFKSFSGGFVGVDIFFVISGYLITTIIISELDAGRFSLTNFYERRARRILPALSLMMFVCLPFAWVWLMPSEMINFSQSLIAVSGFVSNILFWQKTGYFYTAAELVPLLHTWSLSVEEQYYVLFPIFLMLTWKFGKKRIVSALIVFFLASFTIAQIGSTHKPTASFFLLPTRGWELLVGAFLAFYLSRPSKVNLPLIAKEFFGGAGLVLIVTAIFSFNSQTPFPGIYALLPTLGAALIILFATAETKVGQLIGNRLFVYAGLVSYSAYLWHQPLFAFARNRSLAEPGETLYVVLVLLTFALAFLTWRYVEAPFRDKSKFNRRHIFTFAAVGTVAFVCLGLIGHFKNGFVERFDSKYVPLLSFVKEDHLRRDAACKATTPAIKALTSCVLGDQSNVDGLLLGDSHAQMLWDPLNKALTEKKRGFLSIDGAGCPPVRGVYRVDIGSEGNCNEIYESILKFLDEKPEIKYIVMGARWTLYLERTRFDNKQGGIERGDDSFVDFVVGGVPKRHSESERRVLLQSAYKNSVLEFLKTDRKVVLVYPTPEVGWNVPDFYSKSLLFNHRLEDPFISHSYEVFLQRNKATLEAFDSIGEHKNLIRVRPHETLCNTYVKDRCISVLDGQLLYSDDDHLSNKGSSSVVSEIMRSIN